MHINRPIILTLTLAAPFLVAGCSGSGSPSTTQAATSPASPAAASAAGTSPAAAAQSQVSCGLVPAALVNAALGTDLGAPSQSTAPSAVACQFKGAKAGTVEIRIATGETSAAFAAERQTFDSSGQPTKAYAGFGDQAYTSTQKMPLGMPDVNTLVALQGSVELLVSSNASITAEQALEQQLFAKVR
jgi:hypothetical protein